MKLKAISLWRPWAMWIGWGWKTIETREHDMFRTLAGQRIAIHAAMKWDDNWFEAANPHFNFTPEQVAMTERIRAGMPAWEQCLVATAKVVQYADILTGADSRAAMIDCGRVIRSGLVLSGIEEIKPRIICRGFQGIFTVEI